MKRNNVLVIDAGLGNIGSVVSAFQRQDCSIQRVQQPPSPEVAEAFTHAVLPGVGSFSAGMNVLRTSGWDDWIKHYWCQENRPLLGICLGMQLLASEGTEGSDNGCSVEGLDLIPGCVDRLSQSENIVLPHVGWNSLHWLTASSQLGEGIPDGGDMYFVHSYAYQPLNDSHSVAMSHYGQRFTAVVAKGSCYGVQFHPEKSQRLGRRLLQNFLQLSPC